MRAIQNQLLLPFFCAVALAASVLRAENEASAGMALHQVLPSDTDPRITQFSGNGFEHACYFDPSASDRGFLVVFLPGTGGKPEGSHRFCQFAASEGFHVISLAYPDSISISHFQNNPDPDAFQKARENIIYGTTPFLRLNTGVPNSIQSRLHFLLHYLADHYPDEHWTQFFHKNGRNFDYSKIILAGSSQGGGHAALIGYQHEVARVLMFGAPKDFNMHFQSPAKWYGNPSATPLNRFFSFVHNADEGHGCTYAQQLENYKAMKLSPTWPVINVDSSQPPFSHTRLLTSTRPCKAPHPAPLKDPTYQAVWKYMLEEPLNPL